MQCQCYQYSSSDAKGAAGVVSVGAINIHIIRDDDAAATAALLIYVQVKNTVYY